MGSEMGGELSIVLMERFRLGGGIICNWMEIVWFLIINGKYLNMDGFKIIVIMDNRINNIHILNILNLKILFYNNEIKFIF